MKIDINSIVNDALASRCLTKKYYNSPEFFTEENIKAAIFRAMTEYSSLMNKEKDFIIQGLEEGSAQWEHEYKMCRSILQDLVTLKKIKDEEGKTEYYEKNQPLVWQAAKDFLSKYQHL